MKLLTLIGSTVAVLIVAVGGIVLVNELLQTGWTCPTPQDKAEIRAQTQLLNPGAEITTNGHCDADSWSALYEVSSDIPGQGRPISALCRILQDARELNGWNVEESQRGNAACSFLLAKQMAGTQVEVHTTETEAGLHLHARGNY